MRQQRRPWGRPPGPRSHEEQAQQQQEKEGAADSDTATQDISLDNGQLFSQLCAVTNVVKTGPCPGMFTSNVNVHDGVVRVWRHWLNDNLDCGAGAPASQVLWVDSDETVGVRFRVTPAATDKTPVLSGPDDCPSMSYKLEYQGKRFSPYNTYPLDI